jgi:hypothetical protein
MEVKGKQNREKDIADWDNEIPNRDNDLLRCGNEYNKNDEVCP